MPATVVVRRPGGVRRTWEWFWRGRAMAELRASHGLGPARVAELLRRGWSALEVARRTLDPPVRFTDGPADIAAWDLARQAVYWALRAAHLAKTGTDDAVSPAELAELVADAREHCLAAAGSASELAAVEALLADHDYADFGDLPPEEQARSARRLAAFAAALLKCLEAPRARLDRLWFQRITRMCLVFGLIAGSVGGVMTARSLQEGRRDIARGKEWRASSAFPGVTPCTSPAQECTESPFFFFHTLDEDKPWLEIDLGSKQRFTGARIVNREDCCADRAVPLVIEASGDHKSWHEVARRTEVFGNWKPAFPAVTARWVRVRVDKRATLHLNGVKILR